MKNSKAIFILFLTSLFSQFIIAQVIVEDFESGLPGDWSDYTEAGFDFVNAYAGEVSLFKQSDGDEIIILATPEYDLSQYSRMEIDFYGFNLAFNSTTVPDLHIGILDNTGDFQSFRSIYELSVLNNVVETLTIDVGAYANTGNIAFKLVGERSQIIYLDNFKLYDDTFESNIPVAVQNVNIEAFTDGSTDVSFSWTNPALEADGDELTDLDYIALFSEGEEVIRFDNPNIGEDQTFIGSLPNANFYKFEIVPYNDAGPGHPLLSDVTWIGLDFPGSPQNIKVEKNADLATITWDAPTEGANMAFFDGVIDSYTITRSDGISYQIPGTINTFENNLDTEGSINYSIVAENSSGQSPVGMSDPIFHLSDDHVYYEDFNFDVVVGTGETSDYDFSWTTQSNANNSYWDWFASDFIGNGPGEMSWIWGGNGSANDMVRAVSPVIDTEGLGALSLQFDYYFEGVSSSSYTVLIQSSKDGGENWTDVEAIEVTEFIEGTYTKTILNDDIGSDQFQFAFNRVGSSSQNPFMRIDNIRLRPQQEADVRANEIVIPKLVQPGETVLLEALVENNGVAPVNASVMLELYRRFGDQSIVQLYSSDVQDMEVGVVKSLLLGMWPAEEGEYLARLTISSPDDSFLDNNVVETYIDVLKLRERDLVVIEEFSGTWCVNCPGAALAVEQLEEDGIGVAPITYHRSDDFETDIVEEKMEKYGIFGFPTSIFDGNVKYEGGHPSISLFNDYLPIVEEQLAELSPLKVEIPYVLNAVSNQSNHIDCDVVVTSESQILNPNHNLIAVVMETDIDYDWFGLPTLDFVQRAYAEVKVDLSDNSFEHSFSIDLSEIELMSGNLELVVFVQDEDNNKIYNAARLVSEEIPLSVNNIEQIQSNIKIFPNPAIDQLVIQNLVEAGFENLTIHDVKGTRLMTKEIQSDFEDMDISVLAPGMYFIHFENQSNSITKKFVKE